MPRPAAPETPQDKTAWRRHLLRTRRDRPASDRAAVAAALAAGLPAVLDALGCAGAAVLALHVPVGSEPGAAPDGTPPLLDAAVALGHRVLLPVTVGDAPLDWAVHRGPDDLVPGAHGLREPVGPRLGPDAVADAALVLVPALAVDRRGVRLGRGGGHYDRTLPRVPVGRRVALVHDDELVDALPRDPHDARVAHLWCPGPGLVAVGAPAPGGTA